MLQKTPICSRARGRTIIPGRIMAVEVQTQVGCGGVQVQPGDMVGCDDDGVVVVPQAIAQFKPSLSKTVCQSGTIYQQCEAGSRFFDIRFKVHAGKVKTYHTFAKQGAVGGNLDTVLTHVDEFLRANPTEFIILRLSHTMGCADQIIQTAQQYSINNRLYTRRGNRQKERCSTWLSPKVCGRSTVAVRGSARPAQPRLWRARLITWNPPWPHRRPVRR